MLQYTILKRINMCRYPNIYYLALNDWKSSLNWFRRRKEKQDIEDLEIPATKRIFLEQSSYKRQKSKEEKEYLDTLNKEVQSHRLNVAFVVV